MEVRKCGYCTLLRGYSLLGCWHCQLVFCNYSCSWICCTHLLGAVTYAAWAMPSEDCDNQDIGHDIGDLIEDFHLHPMMRWHIWIAPPGLFTYSVMIEGTKESIGRKPRSRMERGENREEENALNYIYYHLETVCLSTISRVRWVAQCLQDLFCFVFLFALFSKSIVVFNLKK